MKNIALIIIILTLFSGRVNAQEEIVSKLFQDYIKEVNNLDKTRDVKRVLRFFDQNFQTNQTYLGLQGVVSRSSQDISGFAKGLQGLISDRDIKLNLTVNKITNISQGRTKATISANLTMDLLVDGNSAEKGGFVVNMAATKSQKTGEWRFVHSDNIRTVEERKAGKCVCYFYERKDGYVTELFYPVGFEYENKLDVFTMRTDDNDLRTIKANYRQYEWDKSGKVIDVFYEDSRKEMGTAKNAKDAITLILAEKYKNNCLGFTQK